MGMGMFHSTVVLRIRIRIPILIHIRKTILNTGLVFRLQIKYTVY